MEDLFEKLEEFIKDDDKIVTIASLSKDLNISITEAVNIIDKYVEIHKESKEIQITYILNGWNKNHSTKSVLLVSNENLEKAKEEYENNAEVTVFSIQKAKQIDFNIIALIDPVEKESKNGLVGGAIIGNNCVRRELRKKNLPQLPAPTLKGKSSFFTKPSNSLKSEEKKGSKNSSDTKASQDTSKPNSITSLFNQAAQNKKPEKDSKSTDKKPKGNGGISNFFTKNPSKESVKMEIKEIKKEESSINSKHNSNKSEEAKEKATIKKESSFSSEINGSNGKKAKEKETKQTEKVKSDLFDSDTDEEILKDIEIKEEKSSLKTPAKSISNKPNQKKKREKSDVGNTKAAKKRRRIVENDSDSDDIFGSDKSDTEQDVIEKSDEEPEPVKIEKPVVPKNKRRKAVDRTYEDEEGFIVTQTEYIYETASEDENEPKNKVIKTEEKPKLEKKKSSTSENDVSPPKGAKGKKVGNKKAPAGNQTTLMNFFKRK